MPSQHIGELGIYSLEAYVDRPLLCITNSDRPTELEKCNLNYLELRYDVPNRLQPQKPFDALSPLSAHSPYNGEVAIYDIGDNGFSLPELVGRIRPSGYKPQHCMWHQGHIWIVGLDRIEIYDRLLTPIGLIQDGWLADGHTVIPADDGTLLVSCSASDSVLVVDSKLKQVTKAFRMPESYYGENYPLGRTDSVVDHYIPNDLQLTHINCASPWRGGILTSSLIPGAIGWFNSAGEYRELISGFVGCHGARRRHADNGVYFSDSCLGTMVFLDNDLKIERRITTGSAWLHDALELNANIIALALTDLNEVRLLDARTRNIVHSISCAAFGDGPQFLSFGK